MKLIVNFILAFIAYTGITILMPIGFCITIVVFVSKRKYKILSKYFYNCAVALDQLGNVTLQHILNFLFIYKNGYKFGHTDETISSVLGKNKKQQKLTVLGKWLDYILEKIEPNHTIKSIEENP